ncbi:hypothetical protein GOV10_02965 [Candidatus Woesearchaeota archaeon]|nr:hypothetical protein [Candidatus Woesearchaeota archaeon]
MSKPFKPSQSPGIDCCISCGETKDINNLPGTPEDSDKYCATHRKEVATWLNRKFMPKKTDEISEKKLPQVALIHLASRQRPKATELIVQHTLKKHHIYTIRDDEKPEMWIYDGGIYLPNGRSHVTEVVRKILGEAFTTAICNDILRKIEADTYVEQEEFFSRQDAHPELLPVQNGVLNIYTKELSSFIAPEQTPLTAF